MFVELSGWWPGFKPERVCRLFQRSWRLLIELLNSCLLFAQNRDDPIQLIEKKKICRPASELNQESAENDFFIAESEPNDSIQRIFGNPNQMRATELCPHHLAKRIQRDGLLLQIPHPPVNQIKPRARRIDADEEKLTTQAKVDGKRNRSELVDLSEVPPCQRALKLFNNALKDCLIHRVKSAYYVC